MGVKEAMSAIFEETIKFKSEGKFIPVEYCSRMNPQLQPNPSLKSRSHAGELVPRFKVVRNDEINAAAAEQVTGLIFRQKRTSKSTPDWGWIYSPK